MVPQLWSLCAPAIFNLVKYEPWIWTVNSAASIKAGKQSVKDQKAKSETLSSLFTSHNSFIGKRLFYLLHCYVRFNSQATWTPTRSTDVQWTSPPDINTRSSTASGRKISKITRRSWGNIGTRREDSIIKKLTIQCFLFPFSTRKFKLVTKNCAAHFSVRLKQIETTQLKIIFCSKLRIIFCLE